MKKFFIKIALMIALVSLSNWLLFFSPIQKSNQFTPIQDKTAWLKDVPPPRVLIIGGSNVIFGINSKQLMETFGRPVVNMGVHGGLGLRFMLAEIEPYTREGDILLVIPEYHHFYGTRQYGTGALLEYIRRFPYKMRHINNLRQAFYLAVNIPQYNNTAVKEVLARWSGQKEGTPYFEGGFNAQGDLDFYLEKKSKDISRELLFKEKNFTKHFDDSTVNLLQDFATRMRAKGVRTVLLFPALSELHYAQNRRDIDRVYEKLNKPADYILPASPADFLFPLDNFFDTVYHLNKTGRIRRTNDIIAILKPYI